MVQVRKVWLVDDLDGEPAAETVRFGIDGATYEIDLSTDNAARLRAATAVYQAAARRTTRTGTGSPTSSRGRGAAGALWSRNQAIRDWARQHGVAVSPRGRLPSAVGEAYHRSH